MDRKRAKQISRTIGGTLAKRFGPRRHYSRSEIGRACEERGYSAADDLMVAMILFGPDDLATDIVRTLALDFDPVLLLDESGELLAMDADPADFFLGGLD